MNTLLIHEKYGAIQLLRTYYTCPYNNIASREDLVLILSATQSSACYVSAPLQMSEYNQTGDNLVNIQGKAEKGQSASAIRVVPCHESKR